MHRFFVPHDTLRETTVVLPEDVAHQVYSVLRMRIGDHITLLDDTGWEFEVRLTDVKRQRVVGEVVNRRLPGVEPRVRITLYQCLLKRDNFEWVLQKCTEIGVTGFVPVISQRTIPRDARNIKAGRMERWRRIIAEAAEQSHRVRLPALWDAAKFKDALMELERYDLCLIPWEKEKKVSLRAALGATGFGNSNPISLALFIGPEGGVADDEIALAKDHGAVTVTFGPRILRAETAAVVAASLILHEFGELE